MKANSKLVIVWGGDDVLSTSIKYFLSEREDLSIADISNEIELNILLNNLDTDGMDIVIIHQKCDNSPANIPMQFLQEFPNIKVIQISLNNNLMDIYHKQKILIKKPIDLISII